MGSFISPDWLLPLGWLLVIGMVDLGLTGIDKGKAIRGERRIRERTLLFIAAIGGWWGLLIGMYAFHHKTSKLFFTAVALVISVIWIYLLRQLVAMYGPPFVL